MYIDAWGWIVWGNLILYCIPSLSYVLALSGLDLWSAFQPFTVPYPNYFYLSILAILFVIQVVVLALSGTDKYWDADAEGLTAATPMIELGIYAGFSAVMTTIMLVQTNKDSESYDSSFTSILKFFNKNDGSLSDELSESI